MNVVMARAAKAVLQTASVVALVIFLEMARTASAHGLVLQHDYNWWKTQTIAAKNAEISAAAEAITISYLTYYNSGRNKVVAQLVNSLDSEGLKKFQTLIVRVSADDIETPNFSREPSYYRLAVDKFYKNNRNGRSASVSEILMCLPEHTPFNCSAYLKWIF